MRIERKRRFGLILAYAAMTVWVQTGHRHGDAVSEPPPSREGAPTAGAARAGHPWIEAGRDPSDCLECQLRSSLHVPLISTAALGGEVVGIAPRIEPARPTARTRQRPSCRAPPLA